MALKTYLADTFQPDFGIPWTPVPGDKELLSWPHEKLAAYLQFREECDQNAIKNPVGQGCETASRGRMVMDGWKKYPSW
jgi:hypothetical protein